MLSMDRLMDSGEPRVACLIRMVRFRRTEEEMIGHEAKGEATPRQPSSLDVSVLWPGVRSLHRTEMVQRVLC